MSPPRVYADFNAIEYMGDGVRAEMAITGYGTLASLACQNLRLFEGLRLTLYEPNDIECDAVAHFDKSRTDPAGRIGAWVARIENHQQVRDCKAPDDELDSHPCIVCGDDFMQQALNRGRDYTEACINCGASVMEPMKRPEIQVR